MQPHPLTTSPSTDPTDLYRYRDAIYATDLLITMMVRLDLFSRLAREPMDLATLCDRLDLQKRPADVMVTLAKSMGLLEERAGVFHATLLACEHATAGSPWFLGPYYAGMQDRPVAQDFLRVLRTGKPSNWASLKDEEAWAKAMENEEFARRFTSAMDSRGVLLGQALAQAVDLGPSDHLLDVAGGSGIYACCLVAANAGLSATVLEKNPVDRIATRCIEERGFKERVGVHSGDMFKDSWPTNADVHLLSNVLHDWDTPAVMHLLRQSFRSLRPGGRLLVHDMHLNAEKTGPLPVAQYSSLLMCITEGKCYSISELEPMLHSVGFRNIRICGAAADRSVIQADRPLSGIAG